MTPDEKYLLQNAAVVGRLMRMFREVYGPPLVVVSVPEPRKVQSMEGA